MRQHKHWRQGDLAFVRVVAHVVRAAHDRAAARTILATPIRAAKDKQYSNHRSSNDSPKHPINGVFLLVILALRL
jgi:hypothetical protein